MPKATFEIRVADLNETHYVLTVTAAPELTRELAGKSFGIPKKKLADLASPDLSSAVNSRDDVLRAPDAPVGQSIKAFGIALFDALLWEHGDVDLWASWKAFAGRPAAACSLRLTLASQLSDLPWEALWDLHAFNLPLARQFSVVRHVQAEQYLAPVDIGRDPLRILVVFADPARDLGEAIAREREAIQTALHPAVAGGRLCIDFIEAGAGSTRDAIRARVTQHAYHILHYFGHGDNGEQGQLGFEGTRRGGPLSWEDVYDLLQPTLSSLRLVVLNACELAQPNKGLVSRTPFTNLAECFLHAGVAMVVAMQYPIRAETATTFSGSFYAYLSAHSFMSAADVESAVVEGRKAIASESNAVEWITPVVFTTMKDTGDVVFWTADPLTDVLAEIRELCNKEHWVKATEKVKEVLQNDPGSAEGLRLRNLLLDKAAFMIQQMDARGSEMVDILWVSRFLR